MWFFLGFSSTASSLDSVGDATLKKKKKELNHWTERRKINLIYNGIRIKKTRIKMWMTISGGKNHTFLCVDNIPFKSYPIEWFDRWHKQQQMCKSIGIERNILIYKRVYISSITTHVHALSIHWGEHIMWAHRMFLSFFFLFFFYLF